MNATIAVVPLSFSREKIQKYEITKLLRTVPIDHSTEILLHAGFPTFLFILILPLKHKVLYTFL